MNLNKSQDRFIIYDVIGKLLVKEIQKWSDLNRIYNVTTNLKRFDLFHFVLTTDIEMQIARLNESDYV